MKRLFLVLMVGAACSAALFTACKVEKEEPLFFETTAAAAYTFPAAEVSATFTVSGNAAWRVEVIEGRNRCTVTPASGMGSATVTVRVAENPVYLQAQAMALRLTAGECTKDIAVTQSAPPCPDFNPGAIAAAGQTVTVGSTPVTIHSEQNATGAGTIGYQWYKNDIAITGATEAYYTPLPADANVVSANTYTHRAKDNICNTTLTESVGSWVLTVICPFDAGAIATTGQTVCSGSAVNTITSSTNASGGQGNIIYEWRRNGIAIASTNAITYNPSAYNTTIGAHTFTRWAKGASCPTDWTQSAGQWVLTVGGTPTLTLISGSANQLKKQGEAIEVVKYTTINATGLTISSGTLPSGVTGSWNTNTYTISGAISASAAVQTYNYTMTTTNSYGCSNAAAAGAITVYSSTAPPTTLCAQCCYNGSSWVDCYVTTNAYPFDNTATNTAVGWSGNGDTYYSGASGSGSDKNGRANTAAIPSIGTSAVQICKNLGTGWYLPAYEELVNMSAGSYLLLNGRSGANLLATPNNYYWSSTECYNNGGRNSNNNTAGKPYAVVVRYDGYLTCTYGTKSGYNYVRCAWRN
jgi:hypothetical protein